MCKRCANQPYTDTGLVFVAHVNKKQMALQTITRRRNPVKNPLESFAVKLLEKIINAPTEQVIDRYIAVAVKTLNSNKVNGYIIQRFIDRTAAWLNNYSPNNPQQTANIQLAKKRLQLFREQISSPKVK